MRLDKLIYQTRNLQSRNKASEYIKNGKVKVDGKTITKPSFEVSETSQIFLDEEYFYVSRSAKKLKYFLEEIEDINLKDKNALDIGSSTGGFTQVLLEYGVKSVSCVDVGSNQLHESIRSNKKVKIFENTDIKDFVPNTTFDIVTCDVSFISVCDILDHINRLAHDTIIILFKPQYEVGREVKRDSKGVVKDQVAIDRAKRKFETLCTALYWKLEYSSVSKVEGKEGNIEELYFYKK
jgi:23S rRNA (cytidine1920-2'-O)/16S rRNA (cytidine1409-2'-O)-methyltransferase